MIIGTIRKEELQQILIAFSRQASRLGASSSYLDALEDIAIATGVGSLTVIPNNILILEEPDEIDEINLYPLSTGRYQDG